MTNFKCIASSLLVAVAIVSASYSVEGAPVNSRPRPGSVFLPDNAESVVDISVGQLDIDPSKADGTDGRRVAFTREIDIDQLQPGRSNVVYSRLVFDRQNTKLRAARDSKRQGWGADLPGDILRITSLSDNSVQYLNDETLTQWSHRSAFFNGGKLRVELLVDDGDSFPAWSKPSLAVASIIVNSQAGRHQDKPLPLPPPTSLCNANDLRRPSSDARVGRLYPIGCTGWHINDAKGCMLTAGHCFSKGRDASEQVFQIHVPNSQPVDEFGQGVPRHPSPDFQWAVDASSVQFEHFARFKDFGYYGTFRNSNTGKSVREAAEGQAFELAAVEKFGDDGFRIVPAVGVRPGAEARITGFGVVDSSDRLHLSQAQQTHAGPLVAARDKYHLNYVVDTTGGNSGSPITLGAGVAIGIHTNGGCESGSNWGSSIAMPALQKVLAEPKGVCA